MNKTLEIDHTFFSGLRNGTGHIKSELIYQSDLCARKWLDLTNDPEYDYYRLELQQIRSICNVNDFSILYDCLAGIHIGAADARKEISIINHIRKSGSNFPVLVVDSSETLLKKSLDILGLEREITPTGALVDVLNHEGLIDAIKQSHISKIRPRLFSIFGNTIGNYSKLSIIEGIYAAMGRSDFLIFGAHKIKGTYPAYEGAGYYAHMEAVLSLLNLDRNHGTLKTKVGKFFNGDVDQVEITFDLDNNIDFLVVDKSCPNNEKEKINRIIVDTSCKYSQRFINNEMSRIGLQTIKTWESENKDNLIILCQKP